MIYCVGVGDEFYGGVDEGVLKRLSERTGGRAFFPRDEAELRKAFTQIQIELRSQYLLQYYANDDVPAGQYLRISVATPAHPAYTIRARQGYYTKRR